MKYGIQKSRDLDVWFIPSGRKTYYFLYRSKSSKKQRLKVGVHGNITCEIAREVVRGWAGDLARGLDPKEHKRKHKAEEKKFITKKTLLKQCADFIPKKTGCLSVSMGN